MRKDVLHRPVSAFQIRIVRSSLAEASQLPSGPTASALWVPETPHTSGDLLIFVDQSTEPVSPLNGVRVARCPLGERS